MANPLKSGGPPAPVKRSPQEVCDHLNDILAGRKPMEHGKNTGQFMRRDDVYWSVVNGSPQIGWINRPASGG